MLTLTPDSSLNCDALVLGAGIVGTSVALHLAKRGLSVALVDRGGPGEGTSYGNTGVIVGANVFPTGFPRSLKKLAQVALKRAPEANYHMRDLLRVAPWLVSYYRFSTRERLEQSALRLRPLMSRSLVEHKGLLAESGALQYLRENGWLTLYRSDASFAAMQPQLEFGAKLGETPQVLDTAGVLAYEPSLAPVFRHALMWPDVASLSNPLKVTQAYAARFCALGGRIVNADARTLRRSGQRWCVDTGAGPIEAANAVVALGPWSPDVLEPLGIRVPLGIKRGYHRHYAASGEAKLSRPVIDTDYGYALAPMEQGIRLTTGAEFAARDAAPTPVQFERVLPHAKALFPLGEPTEPEPWLGRRPNMPDSLPVLGRAPGQPGLWLAFGHGHWGLTLGAVTGRLIAEMMTGATPFTDPAPYRAERFFT
jgi:D-amino-acid dehydrogenase